MDYYWKGISIVFIVILVGCLIGKNERDVYALITLAACILIGLISATYLSPAIALLKKLQSAGEIHWEMLIVLIKTTGIGFVSEVMTCICADTGNSGLGKIVQIMSTALILSMSIPLFETLLETIQSVLAKL